jgi:hypothetical protein
MSSTSTPRACRHPAARSPISLDDEDALVAAAERVTCVSQVFDELKVTGVG